jgi:hypothetical protein
LLSYVQCGSGAFWSAPVGTGKALASQEAIKLLDPPVALPSYDVKQHWHERFHADPGNFWLRTTFVELFGRAQTEPIGTID